MDELREVLAEIVLPVFLAVAVVIGLIWGIVKGMDRLHYNSEVKQCAVLEMAYSKYDFTVGIGNTCYVFIEELGDWRNADRIRLIVELSPQ